jgi:N-acyl-D-aspartate/D-glutamate deacylase
MAFDIVVRGGTIVDGSGLPGFQGDVGITDGVIAEIGDLKGQSAKETIDAEGQVVSPGFIDAHTHMDAQIFWDPLGANVCWNGVTSVVMGNCGYTLAPCSQAQKRLVFSNFERAEEISAAAMEVGIPWSWETIPELYDTLERLPKGLNYGTHIGHSAVRTYVMGQRAFTDKATPDDLEAMKKQVEAGMRAGALGFGTARSTSHRTAEGKPVASRVADWSEIVELTKVLTKLRTGVFQIARGFGSDDPEERKQERDEIRDLALETGRPVTFGSTWYRRKKPGFWREQFAMVDETIAAGGRVLIQASPTWSGSMRSFQTVTPFDKFPVWQDFRKLPLEEQKKGLRDPQMRKKLVDAANNTERSTDPSLPNYFLHGLDWNWVMPYENPLPPHRSVAQIARERGQDPVETFMDLSLDQDLKAFFFSPGHNEDEGFLRALICHPNSGATFSDAGAHVATTINPVQSYLLGYWVREKQAMTIEAAIRKMTFDLAVFWDIRRRGLLREGYHADVTIFSPKTIAPQKPELVNDLPTGAKRLQYKADGIAATIVNGQVYMRNNQHTGVYAGRLMRGSLALN